MASGPFSFTRSQSELILPLAFSYYSWPPGTSLYRNCAYHFSHHAMLSQQHDRDQHLLVVSRNELPQGRHNPPPASPAAFVDAIENDIDEPLLLLQVRQERQRADQIVAHSQEWSMCFWDRKYCVCPLPVVVYPCAFQSSLCSACVSFFMYSLFAYGLDFHRKVPSCTSAKCTPRCCS